MKTKQNLCLHEELGGGFGKLQAYHLDPWEHDGATNPGSSFETHEGQKSNKE